MERVLYSYQYHNGIALAPLIFILVSLVHVPVECLDNDVQVDNLNMFSGRPFFARCTLQLETSFDDKFRNSEFTIVHNQRGTCNVRNFMIEGACKPEHESESHESESCGCSNNWNDMGIQFRFYYYIAEVHSETDEGVSFKCSIQGADMPGALTDNGFINVFGKDEDQPEVPILYKCDGEEAMMYYKFSQRSRNAQSEDPFEYARVFKDGSWIASFEFDESMRSVISIYNMSTRFANRVTYLKLSDQQMTITLQDLHDEDSGTYRVFFYYRKRMNETNMSWDQSAAMLIFFWRLDKVLVPIPKIPLIDKAFTISPIRARADNTCSNCTEVSTEAPTTTEATPAETTTTKKTTPMPLTATTVIPPSAIETQPRMFFIFDKIISITRAPEFDSNAKQILQFQYVSVVPTWNSGISDRAVIFTCKTTNNLKTLGLPPVEVSLYHGFDELIRRVATHAIAFRLTNPDPSKFSKCILTGPSLRCLHYNDRRRKGLLIQINKESIDHVPIAFNSLLYLLAIVINLILLWWTIMTVMHHINLMKRRRGVLEICRAKIILKNNAFHLK